MVQNRVSKQGDKRLIQYYRNKTKIQTKQVKVRQKSTDTENKGRGQNRIYAGRKWVGSVNMSDTSGNQVTDHFNNNNTE